MSQATVMTRLGVRRLDLAQQRDGRGGIDGRVAAERTGEPGQLDRAVDVKPAPSLATLTRPAVEYEGLYKHTWRHPISTVMPMTRKGLEDGLLSATGKAGFHNSDCW